MKSRALILSVAVSAAAIAAGIALFLAPAPAPPGSGPEPDARGLPDNFGIIINTPSQETSLRELDALYARAAGLGAARNNVYAFWDRIETGPGQYDWTVTDAIMSLHKKHDLRATLFFSLVNGETFGPLPDWRGHPDLEAVRAEDVGSVIGAVLARYPGIIDHVIIAGDADAYFEANEDLTGAYGELFDGVRAMIAADHPGVKMGNSFSLDRVLIRETGRIIGELPAGDFVAFTYRPVNLLNEIIKTPQEARADLEAMRDLAGGSPVALFEVGWSTSQAVGGSGADQAAFAAELADYAAGGGALEFAAWYRLHDRPEGSCEVETSPDEGLLVLDSGEYAAANLGAYICGAGLLDELGNPKAAWQALASR